MAVYLIGFILTALFACISRLYYIQYDNQQIVCQNSLITSKSEKWKNDSLVNYIFTAISVYSTYIYYKIYGKEQTIEQEHLTAYSVVKDHKKIYILFMILAILPLFLIAGFRYGVGTDYFYTYSPNFYKILMGESPYSEFGFNLLNRIIQLFTKKDTGLFLVTGFIFSFLLVKTIIKHSDNVLLSLVVVFISCVYFVSLNNVRQSIVSVIMLAAYPYFVKKETVKLLICCLFGMIFHYIAVAIFLVYIVCYSKLIQKYFPIICIVSIICIPVISIVLKEILMHTKYNYYFTSQFYNHKSTIVLVLYTSFFFISFYLGLRSYRMNDRKSFIFLVFQFLAVGISLVSFFIQASEMISRIAQFFLIYQVLSVPYIATKLKNTNYRFMFVSVYIEAYTIYMVYYIILMEYHEVLPYVSIFH